MWAEDCNFIHHLVQLRNSILNKSFWKMIEIYFKGLFFLRVIFFYILRFLGGHKVIGKPIWQILCNPIVNHQKHLETLPAWCSSSLLYFILIFLFGCGNHPGLLSPEFWRPTHWAPANQTVWRQSGDCRAPVEGWAATKRPALRGGRGASLYLWRYTF